MGGAAEDDCAVAGDSEYMPSGKKHTTAHIAMESESNIVQYMTPFPITGPEVEHKGHTYRLAAKQDFLAFRNFADSLDGFTLQYNRCNEVIAWSKKVSGEPVRIMKVFGVFPDVDSETLYDMLQDAVFREIWDTYRIHAFRIAKLNENNDIGYYAAKSPVPGVASRDFVNQRAWINAGNGEYIVFNTSVPHRDVPKDYLKLKNVTDDGVVRAVSKITGYLIRPWKSEEGKRGSCLTYLTQCDPAGWIPTSVMNYISKKIAPNTMKIVGNAAAQFMVWLTQQQNYVKEWLGSPVLYDTPVQHLTIAYAKEKWKINDDSETLKME